MEHKPGSIFEAIEQVLLLKELDEAAATDDNTVVQYLGMKI